MSTDHLRHLGKPSSMPASPEEAQQIVCQIRTLILFSLHGLPNLNLRHYAL